MSRAQALERFRSLLVVDLLKNMPDHVVRYLEFGVIEDAVKDATEGWKAVEDRQLIRGADGIVQDAYDLHIDIKEPSTHLRRLTVTGTYTRDETPEEAEEIQARIAARMWTVDDGPPPKGVRATTMLSQNVWWRPRNAEPLRVKDMEPSHRSNTLEYLLRNAVRYKTAAENEFASLISGPMGPSGDMACDAVDSVMDELLEQTPLAWMEEQPLVRKLTKLVKKDRKNGLIL